MPYNTLSLERLDHVGRIRLERADKRNAQSVELLDELDQALTEALADPEIRVIILAGSGEHFSAGHDLKDPELWRSQGDPETRYAFEDLRYRDYCLRIWDAPKPVIAQVQGACVAAGFMLANMCDLIVASEDAFFADPVVNNFGVAAVEVLVHPWVLGLRAAKHFLFTGARMSAAEALTAGMVNEVVPRAELSDRCLALASKIAEANPFALRLMKRSLNRTAEIQGFRAAIDAHFDTHQLSHMGGEAQGRVAMGLAATRPSQNEAGEPRA